MTASLRNSSLPPSRSQSGAVRNGPSGAPVSGRKGRQESELRQLEAWIAETPESATAKGMYFESFIRMLQKHHVERPSSRKYLPFKDYPLRELMSMMLGATLELHPELSPRDSLRNMGQLVFPTLTSSTVGKIIFSLAGRSWMAALPLTEKSYSVSVTGSAKLRDLREGSATLELRDIWNFADSYHVGILEGAMQSFNIEGTVRARRLQRRCDVDLILEWQ